MPAMDPEAVITSLNQQQIVLGEMALWGCLRGQPKRPGLSLVFELLQLLLQPDQVVDWQSLEYIPQVRRSLDTDHGY